MAQKRERERNTGRREIESNRRTEKSNNIGDRQTDRDIAFRLYVERRMFL